MNPFKKSSIERGPFIGRRLKEFLWKLVPQGFLKERERISYREKTDKTLPRIFVKNLPKDYAKEI